LLLQRAVCRGLMACQESVKQEQLCTGVCQHCTEGPVQAVLAQQQAACVAPSSATHTLSQPTCVHMLAG
jgi:hypothetical protein